MFCLKVRPADGCTRGCASETAAAPREAAAEEVHPRRHRQREPAADEIVEVSVGLCRERGARPGVASATFSRAIGVRPPRMERWSDHVPGGPASPAMVCRPIDYFRPETRPGASRQVGMRRLRHSRTSP
jgi:hypothetical protein